MADLHRFVFELDRAIRMQVRENLETSPELPLTENVAPAKKGVYALYWKGKLIQTSLILLHRRVLSFGSPIRPHSTHPPVGPFRCGRMGRPASATRPMQL